MLPQEQEQISEQDQEKPRPASANQPVDLSNDRERAQAAAAIQKAFRGHKTRRELKGCGLDASTRWDEAVKDATYNSLTRPNDTPRFTRTSQARNDSGDAPQQDIPHTKSSDARKEWRRVGQIARRANADDVSESSSDASGSSTDDVQQGMSREEVQKRRHKRTEARNSRQVNAKTMGIQYFLEMVDQKHRYGSNLRKYHNHWKGQDTKQNFFYWLDYGEGKEVELEECSRERLQTEQVRYLSREERQHYLVTIGKDGLLYWAKNGERVWTKDELYRDSLKGIVPIRDETPKFKYNIKPEDESSSSSSEDSDSEDDINTAPPEDDPSHGYDNEAFHHAKGLNKFKEVSPAVIFNHMIKSHMKKGHKWIFVADTSFRLYIGIKQSGAFQHSSFLHGSRIAAAGLIKVKRGQLRSLAPLSGHYRPPAANFKSFIHHLQDEGVDMSRVSISKSYAVLVGMETYAKTKKKQAEMSDKVTNEKDKVFNPEKAKKKEEEKKDKSESAEKERQFLEKQRREQEERHKQDGTLKKKSLSERIASRFSKLK